MALVSRLEQLGRHENDAVVTKRVRQPVNQRTDSTSGKITGQMHKIFLPLRGPEMGEIYRKRYLSFFIQQKTATLSSHNLLISS